MIILQLVWKQKIGLEKVVGEDGKYFHTLSFSSLRIHYLRGKVVSDLHLAFRVVSRGDDWLLHHSKIGSQFRAKAYREAREDVKQHTDWLVEETGRLTQKLHEVQQERDRFKNAIETLTQLRETINAETRQDTVNTFVAGAD